jgi:cyclopropane fatty-acyl-phospholipid synthase-like methyltransferase
MKVFSRLIEKQFDNNVSILDFGCGAGGLVIGWIMEIYNVSA